MVTGKVKFALWLTPEARELVEQHYRQEGFKSQSAFIEKAVRFYSGFLSAQGSLDFLPRILTDVWEGQLGQLADRVGRMLYKLAVECAIGNHLLAADSDLDYETLERLRARCVQDVRRTNGQISFREILAFQKELEC